MPRLLKILRRWLAIAFLFGVLLVGTIAMLLNTTSGSRFIVNRVAATVPGSLYIDGVDGTLWRTLNLRLLSYRNEKIEVTGNDVELSINWPSLIAGSVSLNLLTVDSLDIHNLEPTSSLPKPLDVKMPPLPVAVFVRAGQVSRLIQQRENDDRVIENISWTAANVDGQRIQADAINFGMFDTEFSLDSVDTTLAGDAPVKAGVSWRRPQDGWSGSGTIDGSLAEISLTHSLQQPVQAQSTGTVQLQGQTEPVFDVETQLNGVSAGSAEFHAVSVRLAGTIDAYDLAYTGSMQEPRLPSTTITGAARGNRNELADGEFEFTSDAYQVYAAGAVAWRPATGISLDVNMEFLDPAFIDEQFPGALSGKFQIDFESADSWRVTNADLAGTLLDFDVAATGGVIASDDQISCRTCVVNVVNKSEPAIDLTGRADGTRENLSVQIDGDYANYRNISAAGTIQQGTDGISGTLMRAAVDESYTGRWVLVRPFAFRTGDDGIHIEGHRWALPEGSVEINRIAASADEVSIQASGTALPLAVANQYLPDGFRLEGSAFANVNVNRSGDTWSGTANWRQSGTVLHVEQVGEETYALTVPEAVANATFADGDAIIESTVRVDPGVSLITTASIDGLSQDPQIDARVELEGERWDWITALFPEIDDLGGDISADLDLNGPLFSPQFGGTARWQNGSANVPELNVPFRDINLDLAIDSSESASVEGTAIAGDGPVTVSGNIESLFGSDRQLDLRIGGDTAEIINWPQYQLWASPDLTVTGSAGGWDARGALDIPRAEINIRELPENAVTISRDVRTADVDFSTSLSQSRYSGEAEVSLGDAVHVSAFGLDTRLEGELTIRKNPDQELSAEGTVRLVDGEFVAYGQRLEIAEGTLTFTGPLDNPIIDVRAIRTIENFEETIVAGLQLSGRAQSINSTVFSEPSMSEADALSYLMIGRPLSEASSAEGGELSTAAVRLGLRQTAQITQQIGQSLGLDELTFVGDGGDATALVAGKQLNSRLYARYAYGVFSRLGMILVRYKLSNRLSLEAGAGETQSIDILYTVEKE